MMRYIFLFSIVIVSLFACKSKNKVNNTDVLDIGEMVPIMFDMMSAGDLTYNDTAQTTRLHLKDSTTIKFQSILAYYKLEKKRFFASMEYYEANPELEIKLVDSLQSYSSNILQKLEKAKSKKDSLERIKNKPKVDTSIKKALPLPIQNRMHKLDSGKVLPPARLLKPAVAPQELKKVN